MVDYDGLRQWSLTFLTPGPSFMKDNFSINGGKGRGWFRGDSSTLYLFIYFKAHCIYWALYFYYYTSSTSDHQALDPRGWESSTLKDILVIQPWMEVVLEGKKMKHKLKGN